MKLVAAIAIADPSLSLRDIAGQVVKLGSGSRAVDANGDRRQSATRWMKRNGSALSATEHEYAEVVVLRDLFAESLQGVARSFPSRHHRSTPSSRWAGRRDGPQKGTRQPEQISSANPS